MNKAKSIVDFYVLCATLKDVIRSGWKVWSVESNRPKTVAEKICWNIFGVKDMKDPYVSGLLKTGKSWSAMWLEFGRKKNKYDDNFIEVSNYVENNKISLAKQIKE